MSLLLIGSHKAQLISKQLFISIQLTFRKFSVKQHSQNMGESGYFCLDSYDCIGFDLDNTLVRYKLSEFVPMEYDHLTRYLVEKKGYGENLLEPMNKHFDCVRKGVILDVSRGNFLQMSATGSIQRASHGTKMMSEQQIVEQYGKDRMWDVGCKFRDDMIEGYGGRLSTEMRVFSDYFDMSSALASMRIVDQLDSKNNGPLPKYSFWPDVLHGLYNMFDRHQFAANGGGYFDSMKANPAKYIHKCSDKMRNWLKNIHDKKTTFLVTGSYADFVNLIAPIAMGPNWKDYFDYIVYFSKKPGFFWDKAPFRHMNGMEEGDIVSPNELIPGSYSQGNWKELFEALKKKTGLNNPRCVYFGDHMGQDVFAPANYTTCDTVAVVEEVQAETSGSSDDAVLLSKAWGSFFRYEQSDQNTNLNTFWGHILQKYSKLCVPSVESLSEVPLDYKFPSFDKGDGLGFYPAVPNSVLA